MAGRGKKAVTGGGTYGKVGEGLERGWRGSGQETDFQSVTKKRLLAVRSQWVELDNCLIFRL
jgi:hypothetical protein